MQEAVEQHLGADLGAVRVHTEAEADILSEQAGRMAFTAGESLIFGHGSYRPAMPEGQRLLAEGLATALAHGPGAPRPLSRATTATGGGGGGFGGHGEGIGAGRPLSAASLFAGTGATNGHATAAQLLPLIRQVYAHPRQTGAHPHVAGPHAAAAVATSIAVVDPTKQYQTMDGWGTSLGWWANDVGGWKGQGGAAAAHYQEIMSKLFTMNGLGLNIVRFNIGGGEHSDPKHPDAHYSPQLHDPRNQSVSSGAAMPGYSREAQGHLRHGDKDYLGTDRYGHDYAFDPRADTNQIAVLRDAHALIQGTQPERRFLAQAYANSAPDWLTTDGLVTGDHAGKGQDAGNNFDPNRRDPGASLTRGQEYGHYLVRTADYFRATYGITFNTIEALNEPDAGWWKTHEQELLDAHGKVVLDAHHKPVMVPDNAQEGMHVDRSVQAQIVRDLLPFAKADHFGVAASDENNSWAGALDVMPNAEEHRLVDAWVHRESARIAHEAAEQVATTERRKLTPAQQQALVASYEQADQRRIEPGMERRTWAQMDNAALLNEWKDPDMQLFDVHGYRADEEQRYFQGSGVSPYGVLRDFAGDPHHPRHKVWMSERYAGDWDTHDPNYQAIARQSTHPPQATDGVGLAQTIIGSLRQSFPSAWIYWQAVEPAGLKTETQQVRDPQTNQVRSEVTTTSENTLGLMRVDFTQPDNARLNSDGIGESGLYIAKEYYVMGNFSRYVRPGYTMVDVHDGQSVAFMSPGGHELVIVTYAKDVIFDLSALPGTAASATMYVTSADVSGWPASSRSIDTTKGQLHHTASGNATTTYVIPIIHGPRSRAE